MVHHFSSENINPSLQKRFGCMILFYTLLFIKCFFSLFLIPYQYPLNLVKEPCFVDTLLLLASLQEHQSNYSLFLGWSIRSQNFFLNQLDSFLEGWTVAVIASALMSSWQMLPCLNGCRNWDLGGISCISLSSGIGESYGFIWFRFLVFPLTSSSTSIDWR